MPAGNAMTRVAPRCPCAVAVALMACARAVGADEPGTAVAAPGDDRFAAGATVELLEPVGGDAFLAGGLVESNASIEGDAVIAGGTVAVRATVGDDLFVAGGQVEVDALVSGDVRIAAGRVRIAPESRVEGDVTIAAGEVTLAGNVAGDVQVYADQLTVTPGTRIGGKLSWRTSQPVNLPPDVSVEGGVAPDNDPAEDATDGQADDRRRASDTAGIGWLWLAGLLGVGWLLVLGFAQFSRRTTRILTERPWAGMGVGLLVLAGVPAVVLALAVTLVGIPLALIMLMLYAATLIAAWVVGALFIGDRALALARPGVSATKGWRLGALLLVLLVLGLLESLPVIGDLARFAVLLLGLGGIGLALWNREDERLAQSQR